MRVFLLSHSLTSEWLCCRLFKIHGLKYTIIWKHLERHSSSMTEEQYHLTRVSTNAGTLQRIRRSILIGVFITLVLTCIEIAIFWVFNLYHLLGDRATPGLADFLTLLLHAPLWWLIPTGELLVTSLTVYTVGHPLALLAYLREVR